LSLFAVAPGVLIFFFGFVVSFSSLFGGRGGFGLGFFFFFCGGGGGVLVFCGFIGGVLWGVGCWVFFFGVPGLWQLG